MTHKDHFLSFHSVHWYFLWFFQSHLGDIFCFYCLFSLGFLLPERTSGVSPVIFYYDDDDIDDEDNEDDCLTCPNGVAAFISPGQSAKPTLKHTTFSQILTFLKTNLFLPEIILLPPLPSLEDKILQIFWVTLTFLHFWHYFNVIYSLNIKENISKSKWQ